MTGARKWRRGNICWASLPSPQGSEPGYRRPVLVISSDAFNASRIQTVIVAVITSNRELSRAPGNVTLAQEYSGLPRDSVINVSQVLTLDRDFLDSPLAALPAELLAEVDRGLMLSLDLPT